MNLLKTKTEVPPIEEVKKCADKGMSITQTYRSLGFASSTWLQKALNFYPDLRAQFLKNGKLNQSIRNRNRGRGF